MRQVDAITMAILLVALWQPVELLLLLSLSLAFSIVFVLLCGRLSSAFSQILWIMSSPLLHLLSELRTLQGAV
jgi:hypothetical protein